MDIKLQKLLLIVIFTALVTTVGTTRADDTDVYLSNDTTLDAATDLKLFSVECSYPMSLEHACGETARQLVRVLREAGANVVTFPVSDYETWDGDV